MPLGLLYNEWYSVLALVQEEFIVLGGTLIQEVGGLPTTLLSLR